MEINISGNGKFNISKVSVDSEVIITKNVNDEYEDVKPTRKTKLLGYIVVFFIAIIMYVIEIMGQAPHTLIGLIDPLTEQYILPVEEGKTYNLTYNEAYFEPLNHKYHYPFMALNGVKLKAKYTYNLENIKYDFQFAKMYYSLVVCIAAIVFGLMIDSIFKIGYLLPIGVCLVLGMTFMCRRINTYKKKLLEELVKLDEGEVL